MNIQEIRTKYPQYNDLSDKQLADSLHEKYYGDLPKEKVYNKIGYKPMSMGEAAFTTATNPLGFGDEIKAGITAGLQKLFGGAATQNIDIGDLYREARTSERAKLDKARQDYPSMTGMIETPSNLARGAVKGLEEVGSGIYQTAADFGADFSGAKAILSKIRPDLKNEIESLTFQDISGILGEKAAQDSKTTEQEGLAYKTGRFAGKVAPFLGVGGASKAGMAVGGGLAGGSELMEDSGVGKRLGSTAVGAVVAPVVGTAVQKVAPYVVSGTKKASSYVKNLFTKDTAEEVGAKAIDPESAKLALKELQDKPTNKPLTAVDIQNPEFKTFARSVVSKYPQAREIVKDFTDGRNKQAFARINDDLKIISKVDNADDYTKQISDTQKSLASPLYAEAEADRTIVPKFEFKEVKTTTSPQTTTVSEGVKSFKTDSSTKTKTDFINKYNLQSKSRDIEKPLVSKEEITGIKIGSSYDKRDLSKKGIEEFQNTLRKQTTRIEEGGKIVNVRKEVTNFDQMSPKSIELAKQLDELENNQIFQETRNKAKQFLNPDALDNSIETLHATREMFDDKISVAIRNGQNKEVRRLSMLRSKVDNLIGEVSPTFKEADNVFRPLAIKKDAVEFGKEFSKYEPSEIIKKINEFTFKSGLKRQDILDDVKVGAKNTIVKDVEQLIKFDSSNIPTEIQVKKIIENEFKRNQLKTFLGEKDYNEFVDNINKEALFNKVSKSLGLNKPSTQKESTNFILRAFNGLISYATSNFGKYAAITNAAKAGEQFLVKNYKGLNAENAKEIAGIITNKNASIKYLENIINKASKQQKPFVSQAVTDLKQLDKFSGIIGANNLDFGIGDANAEEPNMSEDQIRQQLLQQKQQYPSIAGDINVEQEIEPFKKRYLK